MSELTNPAAAAGAAAGAGGGCAVDEAWPTAAVRSQPLRHKQSSTGVSSALAHSTTDRASSSRRYS